MTILSGPTYNLALGTLVKAIVVAHNIYGYSAQSAVNTLGVNV